MDVEKSFAGASINFVMNQTSCIIGFRLDDYICASQMSKQSDCCSLPFISCQLLTKEE
jgi:hypothetical protein